MTAARGSPPSGSSSVGAGGGQGGNGGGSSGNGALNCTSQNSPGGQTSSNGTTGTGGSVNCVSTDQTGNGNETTDWRGAHSIAALRRRASDASQTYSPQAPPPGPQYAHDLEYSSVY